MPTALGLIVAFVISLFSKQQPINISNLTGYFDPLAKAAVFNGKGITVPKLESERLVDGVLGTSDAKKHIEIDLTNQKIFAFENDEEVYSFLISSGKWGRTPTGTFKTWTKLKYTLMTGGLKAIGTYYYLPNVPYTMYFYNKDIPKTMGYGIHGTYWHNNFGHPMSHGCINMKTEDAKILFYWANPPIAESEWGKYMDEENPGTTVIIYGTAPSD
ncbi:hypothetical protein COT49_02440 [candidate division WWE3 bacterium CG08_land_8_20_14_0_20_40_13]|uniref:L,D-TPase catalytic domain-containing protein n=1 Tax=candidate division WWE3 bacterium CG08_land_8_20_14_0_20_40_13 TaxID=1975084 RepID=A0A2H0XDI5_UNCKA|nr:MAG: hypothetical protein COT49_02440 [candidate division WWE3 bacterium CG08_land_8_20_14_0_20_40_13]